MSLASEGRPRLLLVEDGPPPVVVDPFEDWVRLPADDIEMRARVENLRRRWEAPRKPKLDENGVLTWGDRWVAVSPLEARITAVLLARFTMIVSHASLAQAAQSSDDLRANSLNVQVHRLRRRLASLGLVIRTVRKRGYVLEPRPEGEYGIDEP